MCFVLPFLVNCFSLVEFNGLKLNKMTVLKKHLSANKLTVKNCLFRIRFSAGNESVDTESFKIVSSFSQLPHELQQQRNNKRTTIDRTTLSDNDNKPL